MGRPKFDSTQVGSEGENLYFYRMPGSGLSIYTGNVLVLNKNYQQLLKNYNEIAAKSNSATILVILIIGFTAGPAVSL